MHVRKNCWPHLSIISTDSDRLHYYTVKTAVKDRFKRRKINYLWVWVCVCAGFVLRWITLFKWMGLGTWVSMVLTKPQTLVYLTFSFILFPLFEVKKKHIQIYWNENVSNICWFYSKLNNCVQMSSASLGLFYENFIGYFEEFANISHLQMSRKAINIFVNWMFRLFINFWENVFSFVPSSLIWIISTMKLQNGKNSVQHRVFFCYFIRWSTWYQKRDTSYLK